MSESRIGFDQWPDGRLEEVGISVDRARAIHGIIERWEAHTLPGEVAYSALTLMYYMNAPLDNDETRLYQQDMIQRFVFNAEIDNDRVHALDEDARRVLEAEKLALY